MHQFEVESIGKELGWDNDTRLREILYWLSTSHPILLHDLELHMQRRVAAVRGSPCVYVCRICGYGVRFECGAESDGTCPKCEAHMVLLGVDNELLKCALCGNQDRGRHFRTDRDGQQYCENCWDERLA